MLVLGRRPGESIRIGDEITITLISVAPGQVRIGIDAPAQISVHREEIYQEIASLNLQSVSAGAESLGWLREAAGEEPQ